MPNFGLMSGGQYGPYYSGPSGMAAGVNSFADNLMKAYGMFSGVRQRDEEIAIAKKYREQQEQLQAAQMDAIRQKSMEDAAVRSGQMNLRGNVNMPGLMAKGYVNPNTDVNAFSGAQDPALTPNLSRPDAIGSSDPVAMQQVGRMQTPQGMEGMLLEPTMQQRIDQLMVDSPVEGIEKGIKFAGIEQRQNPIVTKLIEAANNGTLNDQGKAVLKSLGYDYFNAKPEPLGVKVGDKQTWTSGRTVRDMMYTGGPPTDEKSWKEVGRGEKDRPANISINHNGLSDAESAVIGDAIAERRLDPYKVNSRNQKQIAATLLASPGLNLNKISGDLGAQRNVNLMQKAGVAEMLPELIAQTQELGKELKYSDFAPLGKGQRFIDAATNDPKYIEYVTKRNDLILTIGGVMRANGMTDMAQKLEEDSAPRSMSPKAFDAWAKGQMDSLAPRIKMYRSQLEGQGTPRGETSIPAAAINFLKQNPRNAIFFDQKYGNGASKRVLGGQ